MQPGEARDGLEWKLTESQEKALVSIGTLVREIATSNSFVYAEALWPRPDGSCLVQSPAHHCASVGAKRFREASREFCFHPHIGIPGRVWKQKTPAWHGDTSELPTTIFLRADLARHCNLRGCVAVPIEAPFPSCRPLVADLKLPPPYLLTTVMFLTEISLHAPARRPATPNSSSSPCSTPLTLSPTRVRPPASSIP